MSPREEPRQVGHLGPHAVGSRVVVRRVLPGESGPTGGPAFTDVLGVLERWDTSPDGAAVVRRDDGSTVTFATGLVVSGKPVPPRPSRFSRLPPEQVLRRAEGGFRRLDGRMLGAWELRYVGGANPRANAALVVGDPGRPLDEALAEVVAFAAGHDRPAVAEVVVGSELDHALLGRGWEPLGGDTDVLVAGVAALARAVSGVDLGEVRHEDALTRAWLVGNDRALANFDTVAATLDLPDLVFASVSRGDRQLGRVRVNLVGDGAGPWAYVADLMVAPEARRQGVGRLMMAAAITWAAERGTSAMVLDTDADNVASHALYDGLGFERHHAFRLLRAPAG